MLHKFEGDHPNETIIYRYSPPILDSSATPCHVQKRLPFVTVGRI